MNYILFDTTIRNSLLPFTHTRPIADIRCGIMTLRERWEHFFKQTSSTLTTAFLQPVFNLNIADENTFINGSLFASEGLYNEISNLELNEKLVKDNILLAFKTTEKNFSFEDLEDKTHAYRSKEFNDEINLIKNVWDIFSLNENALREDFYLLTKGKKSQPLPDNIIVTGKENIFLEEGAVINAGCIINATTGPVYLAKNAEILEGCIIRGALALGEYAVIKMGAKIYGATTIGAGCKVGGEISNVVFFANSNKGHDGYLGNAVIGEWCNLGADTNCSNLKNNYDYIKIWDEHNNKSVQTGLQFCGLMMGDHSKCGINTMFNTGTVIGVSANIFGSGFPEKFIPSFCWGGSDGLTTYDLKRAIETANRMMQRRGKSLSEDEKDLFKYIFNQTQSQRDTFEHS